ncbi:chl4 [Niveomyces insectorum RCEF 264]|uniref:Chl4 n=1 Tax=Niveomyces insectorum RCEF 264 TaxID=1081102 RepID=A0A167TTG4_9HYPO|nr:chl4 [Niveomyces insectorum RCEF 264]
MAPLSIPVASRLPSSLRIEPSSAAIARVFSRLSRPSLLSLALDWLDEGNQALTAPYLRQRRQRRRRRRERDDDNGEEEAAEEEEEEEEDEEEGNDDDGDFYPPASSLEELQDHYTALQARKGSKREVLDRVLEGDWRHGISLYQLAMADLQYLYDHPTSQKWTAFRVVPLKPEQSKGNGNGNGSDDSDAAVSAVVDRAALAVPRFHPSSFLRNLQAQILPDVKVHYQFDRHKHLPLLLLRIFVLDSPYNTARATASVDGAAATGFATIEAARTIYVAFPDAAPYVFLSSAQVVAATNSGGPSAAGPAALSLSSPSAAAAVANPVPPAPPQPPAASSGNGGRGETRSLRSLVVEAIPKALSRPRARYALQPTNLATRNLAELLHRRGAGRTNTAGGGWSIYADEKMIESPLSTLLPPAARATAPDAASDKENTLHGPTAATTNKRRAASPEAARAAREAKRRKQVAAARFGPSALIGDGRGVERVDVVMQDPFLYPAGVGRPAGEEADGDEDELEHSALTDRRRSRGGRHSQIHAALAREADEEEEDDAANNNEEGNEDGEAEEPAWCPRVAFTFHGPHVFAGIRQLVEAGVIDGEKMPGWLTGEEGVTVGAVRHGRIRGHKGSGML